MNKEHKAIAIIGFISVLSAVINSINQTTTQDMIISIIADTIVYMTILTIVYFLIAWILKKFKK